MLLLGELRYAVSNTVEAHVYTRANMRREVAMPAMLTHDFFGQDAYGSALKSVNLFTPDERDAFLLGNQGPDPLFYLMLLPPLHEFEELGSNMHKVAPSPIFVSLRRAVDALPEVDKPIGQAYLAGFTCHYLLDRAMHPLVFWWEKSICRAGVDGLDVTDHSIVHAEIERDLDEMVLFAKRNQTIQAYRPYEEVLRGSDNMLRVVGDVYFGSLVGPLAEEEPSAARVFPLAVACFRVAQRMFYSPGGTKARLFERIEKPARRIRYSLVKAMSHRVRAELVSDFDNRDNRPWRNPFTGARSTASFWDLYNGALDEVPAALEMVFADGFDEEAAHALTHGINFGGDCVE